MAGVPINFAVPSEGAVASYSWTDIASGQGFVRFYLAQELQGGNTSYILTDTQIYSNTSDVTSTGTNADTFTKTNTLTFSSSVFNTPRTIRGFARFSISIGAHSTSGGTGSGAIVAILKKVSGGVTTTLCTTGLSDNTSGGTAVPVGHKRVLMLKEITETSLKIGDILQLDIDFYALNASSTSGYIGYCDLGTDPLNQNGTWIKPQTETGDRTDSFVEIPFEVNL